MSNKIHSKKTPKTFLTEETISQKCHDCGKTGEILIRERTDTGLVKITDKYYLCKPCFLKLLTPICPECEEQNKEYSLARDTERLEIVCTTCGIVLTSLITEEHHEKRDYTTNRPVEFIDDGNVYIPLCNR